MATLILADPVLSVPRFAAGTAALRSGLPPQVREVLDEHEAARTTDSAEYQAATLVFYSRNFCRLDPWPEPLQRSFATMNAAMYEHMYGPNEFTATGTEKAYDLTDRLNRLTVPVLLLCGRHDEARPEDTAFSRDRIRDAEFVVFDRSSHMPHLEEPAFFLQVLRTFLARAEVAEERTS